MKLFIYSILLFLVHNALGISLSSMLNSKELSFNELSHTEQGSITEKEPKVRKSFMNVYMVHQGNRPLHDGKYTKFQLEYDRENLLFVTKKGQKKIPLNELIYYEKQFIFTINQLESLDNQLFRNFVHKNFLLGIQSLMSKDKDMREHSLCVFHHRKREVNGTIAERDFAIIFAPIEDEIKDGSAARSMEFFKSRLQTKFHNVMKNLETVNLNLPELMEQRDNHFVYWNSQDLFREPASYHVGIADEGVVLNQLANNTLHTVKIAFRFDQLFECDGSKNVTGHVHPENVRKSLPIPSCCVSYNINWHEKPTKEVFCSIANNSLTCENEMSVFKRFIFKKCVESGVNQLGRIVENGQNVENFGNNSKMQFKLLLDSIQKYKLITKIMKNHPLLRYFMLLDKNFGNLQKRLNETLKGVDIDFMLNNRKSNRGGNEDKESNNKVKKISKNDLDIGKVEVNPDKLIKGKKKGNENGNGNIPTFKKTNKTKGKGKDKKKGSEGTKNGTPKGTPKGTQNDTKIVTQNGNTNSSNTDNSDNSDYSDDEFGGTYNIDNTQKIENDDNYLNTLNTPNTPNTPKSKNLTDALTPKYPSTQNPSSKLVGVKNLTDPDSNVTTYEATTAHKVYLIDNGTNPLLTNATQGENYIITQTTKKIKEGAADPFAYLDERDNNEEQKKEEEQKKKDLAEAKKSVNLSKAVIDSLEKQLKRQMNTQEVVTVISLVMNKELLELFKVVIEKKLKVPDEIVTKLNQMSYLEIAELLKKVIKGDKLTVQKTNKITPFSPKKINKNSTPHNLNKNGSVLPLNATLKPKLPVDVYTGFDTDDEIFYGLLNKTNNSTMRTEKKEEIPKATLKVPKNWSKAINIPEVIKRIKVVQKPKVNEKDKPKVNEKDKPKVNEKDKPKVNEKDKPKVNEKDKTKVNEKNKPKVNEKDKPKVNEKDKPKVNEKDKPKPAEKKRPVKPRELLKIEHKVGG